MTDFKEFAKQMRENAIKNKQGNIVCSPELWEEIASVIERAILPPCKVGDKVYFVQDSKIYEETVVDVMSKEFYFVDDSDSKWKYRVVTPYNYFGKIVFLTKEEAEQALAERSNG